ncbi:MAG TPA: hypothetical protein GX731_05910, partial [Clostridiales bacterium]|nr:hypothetical protein [Clostridiales bacterium]
DYAITKLDINWEYYENSSYKELYNKVKKITFADNFTGSVLDPIYPFPSVRTIEFQGSNTPDKVYVSLSNRSKNPDVVFIVPKGTETAYSNVIEENISYYNGSDLYEMEIPMKPTIIAKGTDKVENGVFANNGLLYQVTSSAKNGKGKVQLIGITNEMKHSYLNLAKELKNNGFTYELTKLLKFSLVRIGATEIVVPDTVTEMESYVFDKQVELLYLSKNCKVIPKNMITDENQESNLKYVYIPKEVTTIAANAFPKSSKVVRTPTKDKSDKVDKPNKSFSYWVSNPFINRISLYQDNPKVSLKSSFIPKLIIWNGKAYKLTGAIASFDDIRMPLIIDRYRYFNADNIHFQKNNKVYLGSSEIFKSANNISTLIYLPKDSVSPYKSSLWLRPNESQIEYNISLY